MGNIVLLDDLTINKIAAGEVVERPASVIKEMVENSIDAGATSINIEMKNGGISYIRITDNGKGITPDDMELAFERHATSKIRSANDLDNVKSMGFRGEALASISAISNVEMMSKTADANVGNKIIVEAGKTLKIEETGSPIGTTITVKNLFFNTPVRYKFLKKDYTESGYIEDAVTRLALINPQIAFKLINTGKTVIQTSGNGNIQDVIYAIYGKDVASAIINVDYTYEGIHITGVVGKPEIARSNRANQLFFVNKRFVKDRTLSSASESSFKGLLPIGKYGFLILNVDIDPSKVDVNVHPAKLEVRFQEDNVVFKAVFHAIKDTLLKAELIANVKEDNNEITENKFVSNVQIDNAARPNITELFRRIAKNSNKENIENSKNFIQDIYEKKDEDNTLNVPIVKSIEEEKKLSQEKIIDYTTPINEKMDVFKELMEMQKRLKQEAENDPKLHTDIDRLISDTKKIGENTSENENTQNTIENNETEEISGNDNTEEMAKNNDIEQTLDVGATWHITQDIEQTSDVETTLDTTQETQDKKTYTHEEIQRMIDKLETMDNIEQNPEFGKMYEEIFGKLPASVEEKQREEKEKFNAYELIKDNNMSVFEESEEYNKQTYKFVGIAFNTYIIIEIQNEMYIIDQHAAHERIMYEKVKQNYYAEGDKDSQMLLLPDIITLTHKEMGIARDNFEMFEQAGFILEEFGENTIKLSGAPNICVSLDTKELFLETLDEINTVARTAKQEIEEKFIATVACKAAVKAHMVLTVEEVDTLMNDLLKLPNPFTCPHGRPTAIKMDKQDIEKKFARRK